MKLITIAAAALTFLSSPAAAGDLIYDHCLKDFSHERAVEFAACTSKVFLDEWQKRKLPHFDRALAFTVGRMVWAERVEAGQMTPAEFNAADARARSQILDESQQRRIVISEESRRAAWDLMMHRNIKQPLAAPKPMHCHISSTGRWMNCF